jgi:hypothetical protein
VPLHLQRDSHRLRSTHKAAETLKISAHSDGPMDHHHAPHPQLHTQRTKRSVSPSAGSSGVISISQVPYEPLRPSRDE